MRMLHITKTIFKIRSLKILITKTFFYTFQSAVTCDPPSLTLTAFVVCYGLSSSLMFYKSDVFKQLDDKLFLFAEPEDLWLRHLESSDLLELKFYRFSSVRGIFMVLLSAHLVLCVIIFYKVRGQCLPKHLGLYNPFVTNIANV